MFCFKHIGVYATLLHTEQISWKNLFCKMRNKNKNEVIFLTSSSHG